MPLFAATITVTNTNDAGPGSLRQALANAVEGDRIEFAIGSGPQTLQPRSPLGNNGAFITIDGTTQPGYNGQPLIEIDGSLVGGDFIDSHGLAVDGDVRALVINNCAGPGLRISRGSVRGCYIGTDRTGTIARPNFRGIFVWPVSGWVEGPLVIGGPNPADANLISGNDDSGIDAGSNNGGVTIQGNTLGSDIHQTVALGSTDVHIRQQGSDPALQIIANVIVGARSGISVSGDGFPVHDNYIGVTPGGKIIPNQIGLAFYSSTDSSIRRNTIKGNETGVLIYGGLRNEIAANSMEKNGLGIDLSNDYAGVTPNDPGDLDAGANNFINFPVLTRATVQATTIITGTVSTVPNRTYRIDFYGNASCNSSNHGEGRDHLGSVEVTTDGTGEASFTHTLSWVAPGTVLTATSTSALEGTSEFSACVTAEGAGRFSFDTAALSASEGDSATLTVRRLQGTAGAASVSYTVSGGNAMPGADFTGGSGTLSFADGEASQTFQLAIVDDAIYDAGETIVVTLTNPTDGTAIAVPASVTVTIGDDDPAPSVTIGSISVTEGTSGTSAARVPLILAGPLGSPYSVAYTIDTGSATQGEDFIAGSGTVTFQPGETEQHVSIAIIGDTILEPDESFDVRLTDQPAVRGTVTILNDDLGVTPAQRSIAAATAGTFTVLLGQTRGEDTVLTLSSDAPDAVAVPSTLVIRAGTSSADFGATALLPGHSATITITLPAALGGFAYSVRVDTYVKATLQFTPARIEMFEGQSTTVSVLVTPPNAITIGLTATGSVQIPRSLTIPAGATATFTVKATRTGAFTIDALLPPEHGSEVQSLFGDVLRLPATPTILGIAPSRGSTSGGTAVTISGANLRAGCAVAFGNVPAASQFENNARMSAVTPAHTRGVVDVKLTCGNDMFTLRGGFEFVPEAPQLSEIRPSSGTVAGGTLVQAKGAQFDSSCWMFFGSAAATDLTYRDSQTLTVRTPAHPAGSAGVEVRCSGGTSAAPGAFTFSTEADPAPFLASIEPAAASPGEPVTIRGLSFRTEDAVFFESSSATILDVLPDAIVVVVPERAAGRVSVSVTDSRGRTTTSGPTFTVLEGRPPRVSRVSPSALRAGGEIEITGEGFRSAYTFHIAGRAAKLVTSTYTSAVVVVDSGVTPGTYAVEVYNSAGVLAAIGPNVTITAAGIVVSSVQPRCSTTDGGILGTIGGAGFTPGVQVAFDDIAASDVSLLDASTLRVRIPQGTAGPARVTVSDGTSTATLTNGFAYDSPFAPRTSCRGRRRAARH